jgi:hypothetical protein
MELHLDDLNERKLSVDLKCREKCKQRFWMSKMADIFEKKVMFD